MSYHYANKIEVTNCPEPKPENMHWVKNRPRYQVRSDAGNLACKFDDCKTLTEARKFARARAKSCGWSEIFQWAENSTQLRKFFIAEYTRELIA